MVDRSKFKDDMGKFITQGIFLETNYNTEQAVYTLKDYDHTHKGVVYPSLKLLYLKEEDPTEYLFAEKYLAGWPHWKRLVGNVVIRRYIDDWREELELKLRAYAIRELKMLVESENGNFQAAKFLADRGWDKRAAGRPSKAETEKRAAIDRHISDEFAGDVKRLEDYRKS